MGYTDIVVSRSSTVSSICVDAAVVTRVAVVPSVSDVGGHTGLVVDVTLPELGLGSTSVATEVEWMLVVLAPDDAVDDDDDTIECTDVLGSKNSLLLDGVPDETVGVIGAVVVVVVMVVVLCLDVTTLEHGKQLEMT